jgi:aminoglycoside 6-adenylyltransferase
MDVPAWKPGEPYGYLMQFMDGNRIDLTLFPLSKVEEVYGINGCRDSLSTTLLDKDGIIPPFPPANDKDHLPKPPTAKDFHDCCNEFWWVSPYAAKGLWREELVYAKWMLDSYVREQLMKMLDWYVGVQTGFSVSTGKYGKYLQRCLEPELWEMLQQTYSDTGYTNIWQALNVMTRLFRRIAIPVSEHFGFEYPHTEDQRVSAHLDHVRRLPKDAETMY